MGTVLTEILIKSLKPSEKRFTVSESGLVLEVRTNGDKCWFARVFFNNKEYRKAIGKYPEVSLKEARKIVKGLREDPESVIVEKRQKCLFQVSTGHAETIKSRANKYILPSFGNMNVADINSQMVLKFLRKFEQQGLIETTKRVRQIVGAVFRFAMVLWLCPD